MSVGQISTIEPKDNFPQPLAWLFKLKEVVMYETTDVEEMKSIEQLKAEGKSFLCKMDASGDKRITWFPDDAEEIKKAKEEFDKLKKEGWKFYVKGAISGNKQEEIKEFRADAAQIIAVPQFKAG